MPCVPSGRDEGEEFTRLTTLEAEGSTSRCSSLRYALFRAPDHVVAPTAVHRCIAVIVIVIVSLFPVVSDIEKNAVMLYMGQHDVLTALTIAVCP